MTSELFPHETIRPIQSEYISDVKQAIESGKTLVAHAPTGLGKTAAVLAPAIEYALANNKVVFFLTNRHTQHAIAIDTIKNMNSMHAKSIACIDLIGKRWMCNQDVENLYSNEFNEYCKAVVENKECEYYNNFKEGNKVTAKGKHVLITLQNSALHNEELIQHCRVDKVCSYEVAMKLAEKAKVVVADYHYAFNPFIQTKILNRLQIPLSDVILIVDEGHNLPNRVMDLMSSTLTSFSLNNAIQEGKKNGYFKVAGWLDKISDMLDDLGQGAEQEKVVQKEVVMSGINSIMDYDELVEELLDIADDIRKIQKRSFIGAVGIFLDEWPKEREGLIRFMSKKSGKYGPQITLHYSCLDPSIITRDVFEQCHSAIVMSGTLRPASMYSDLLGIDDNIEKEYPSSFPPENKLSIIIPETTTRYSARSQDMFKQIAKRCSEINQRIPGNVAIFFPSYDLMNSVAFLIDHAGKKAFREQRSMSKEDKETFLDEFKREKNDSGGLLLAVAGANFAEGVDFPGDLLNGVVIVGLPLARPDLKTKATIQYYDQKLGKGWDYGYTFPAMNKCFQSAGRCIRSASDRGVVIYLDERFAWSNYFRLFDRENLLVTRNWKPLVEKFYQNGPI